MAEQDRLYFSKESGTDVGNLFSFNSQYRTARSSTPTALENSRCVKPARIRAALSWRPVMMFAYFRSFRSLRDSVAAQIIRGGGGRRYRHPAENAYLIAILYLAAFLHCGDLQLT
jgi:hypothetical protein